MPKYATFKYGIIGKYGRYDLGTSDKAAIGPYVRYRIRTINSDDKSEYLMMAQERIDIPSGATIDRIRIRAGDDGDWVYLDTVEALGETQKVRIRGIESDGGYTEWVYGEKGNLKLI
jgi:hypothetical protein